MATMKEGVSKSNYSIQNPLLLVTEPRTRDSTITYHTSSPETSHTTLTII
jgi:hypothetical protein